MEIRDLSAEVSNSAHYRSVTNWDAQHQGTCVPRNTTRRRQNSIDVTGTEQCGYLYAGASATGHTRDGVHKRTCTRQHTRWIHQPASMPCLARIIRCNEQENAVPQMATLKNHSASGQPINHEHFVVPTRLPNRRPSKRKGQQQSHCEGSRRHAATPLA